MTDEVDPNRDLPRWFGEHIVVDALVHAAQHIEIVHRRIERCRGRVLFRFIVIRRVGQANSRLYRWSRRYSFSIPVAVADPFYTHIAILDVN